VLAKEERAFYEFASMSKVKAKGLDPPATGDDKVSVEAIATHR
jgi:hypothetical protein